VKRALIALALSVATAHAAQTARVVTPGAAGPNRLDVDVPLLAAAAPDLADVRLSDPEGREIGYLRIEPRATEPKWIAASLLDVKQTKTTSGFEADLGSIKPVDRLHIGGVRSPFLKHVTLEGSGDRAHWTLLADATVFDLPDQKLRRSDIAFTAGDYRYLRVTWDDRNSARVSGVTIAEARLHDSAAPPEPLRASMPFQKLSSEPSRSRYRITLPGPHLPIDAIEVQVATGDVFRGASITEPELTNGAIVPAPLGTAQLRRAVRDGFVAAEMAIPIHAPSGRELQLVIDDGANAPLPVSAIIARFAPQPWIYFESADGAPLTVRYGDPRAQARYDLEAARPYVGRSRVSLAHWTTSPAAIAQTAAAPAIPMPNVGSVVEPKTFRYSRPLPPATGLVILPLDADVLAHTRDLVDVRIIDRTNHQVPYVVERRDEPLKLQIAVPAREESEHGTSRYRIHLPFDTLPSGSRMVVRTNARVFERQVHLTRVGDERRGREEADLAEADWKNVDPDTPAAPLTFDAPLYGSSDVDLLVSEGDNAPLPIASIELLQPSYALRFEHPGGPLTLLYGSSAASAPVYDLALLAPRILTEPATEIAIGKPPHATAPVAPNERKYFWIAIAAAAVILLGLLARLIAPALREEPGTLGETPGAGDSPR